MKIEKINEDKRGEIYLLTGLKQYPELTIFVTKEEFARGGCIHKINDEFSCVVEGRVAYYIGDNCQVLNEGETILIPKNTPHYLFSIIDSTVLEWGATSAEKKEKHPQFRAIVDELNKRK